MTRNKAIIAIRSIIANSHFDRNPFALTDISETVLHEVIATHYPSFDLEGFLNSNAFHEVESLLFFLGTAVEEILAQYDDSWRILCLARDADVIYDALALTMPNGILEGRIRLVPASREFLQAISDPKPRRWQYRDVLHFFSLNGLDIESLERGVRFLVLDSGLRGSSALKLRDLFLSLASRRGLIANTSLRELENSFQIKLVGGTSMLNGVSELVDFEGKKYDDGSFCLVNLDKSFPETFPIARKVFDSVKVRVSVNNVVACAIQRLPRYHGSFQRLPYDWSVPAPH